MRKRAKRRSIPRPCVRADTGPPRKFEGSGRLPAYLSASPRRIPSARIFL